MLHSGCAVRRPLHRLVAKQAKQASIRWAQLRDNSAQRRENVARVSLAASDIQVDKDDEIYRHTEHLSLANLKNFVDIARHQCQDLEKVFDQYTRARHSTRSYSFTSDCSTLGEQCSEDVDTKCVLDGQHLDALFNVDSSSDRLPEAVPLHESNYDRDLLLTPRDGAVDDKCVRSLPESLAEMFFMSALDLMSSSPPHASCNASQEILKWNTVSPTQEPITYMQRPNVSQAVVFCSSADKSSSSKEDNSDKPSLDKLHMMHEYLQDAVSANCL